MTNILDYGANPMGTLATEHRPSTTQGEPPAQTHTRLLSTLFNEHLRVTLKRVQARKMPTGDYDSEIEIPACWEVAVRKKRIIRGKVDGATLERAYYEAFNKIGVPLTYTTLIQGVDGAVQIPDEAMAQLAEILDSKGTADERAIKRSDFLQTVLRGVGIVREAGRGR